MILRERATPVSTELRSWIATIRTGAVRQDDQTVLEDPDHTVTLAMRLDPGFEDDVVVIGPRTRAVYFKGQPGRSWMKLRVHPQHVRPLFGTAVGELVNNAVPLAALWGDRAVRTSVAGKPAEELAKVFDAKGTPDHRDDLIRQAAGLLSAGERVDATAQRLSVSERQLRKQFSGTLGISPNQFARIQRIRSVLRHVGRVPLAQLAPYTGYFDQAHLTNEFRNVMGVPPARFAKGTLPPAMKCQSQQ